MAGSSSARIGRISRYFLAIVALVMALGGLGASPVSANQRGTAVNEANNMISACFKADGEVWETYSDSRHIDVFCEYEDGQLNCRWDAESNWTAQCAWTPRTITGNLAAGGNIGDGGTILPERVASVAPGKVIVVSPETLAASDGARTAEQEQKAKGKGKHEKHHGKGRHKGGKRR